MGFLRDFSFTFFLALLGFIAGSVILFRTGLGYYSSSIFLEQPVSFFANYFNKELSFYAKSFIYGIVGALILGFIGFIIDFKRR